MSFSHRQPECFEPKDFELFDNSTDAGTLEKHVDPRRLQTIIKEALHGNQKFPSRFFATLVTLDKQTLIEESEVEL